MDLKEIYELQIKLQEKIGCHLLNLTYEDRVKWTKENIIAINAELIELLDWLPWKHWSKKEKPLTSERLKEIQFEIIDILHFWLNLCLIWEMDPQIIIDRYEEKNRINHGRQNNNY